MRYLRYISALACLLLAPNCFATNWYVSKGAAGSNSGTNWTNAWTEFSSINYGSVACGDTIWIASGTYTSALSVGKSCTVGNVLTIERVLASDSVPVAAAGWSAGLDGLVTINASISDPAGNYITIDGRTLYGIKVNIAAGGGNGVTAATSGPVDHLTLTNFEVAGPSCASAGNCSTAAYGVNIAPSVNIVSNLLVDHCNVHHVSETFRESQWQNSTIQYCQIHDMFNDGIDHEDVIYDYPFSGSGNVAIRYNKIFNSPNDGIFFEFGGAQNFKLYGNVFYASNVGFGTFKAPGTYGPIHIVNNTFQSPTGPCSSNCSFYQTNGSTMTGCVVENNVFYYVSNSLDGCTIDHNAYNYSSLGGFPWPSGESGAFNTVTASSFVNVAGGDFHLTSGSVLKNKGVALAAEYNTDMDGHIRGADGVWDVGAFELAGAALAPPTNLSVFAVH